MMKRLIVAGVLLVTWASAMVAAQPYAAQIQQALRSMGLSPAASSGGVTITGDIYLPKTVNATQDGRIFKDGVRWLHDFSYGLNGSGFVPDGHNIFLGDEAGNFTTGSTGIATDASDNIGIGYRAMTAVTGGHRNICLGTNCLRALTQGNYNYAMGMTAMITLTSGSYNNGLGYQALSATNGEYNVAVGHSALSSESNGGSAGKNTALGAGAMQETTTGTNSVAVGFNAGRYYSTGTSANLTPVNGVYVGQDSRASAASVTNEIVVGSAAIGNGANTSTIGSSAVIRHYVNGIYVSVNATPAVSNTSANSCGTTAATITGTNDTGVVTVGATSGTSCTMTFTIAAPTRRQCVITNETTGNLVRATYTDTTHSVFVGTFVAADKLAYLCSTY